MQNYPSLARIYHLFTVVCVLRIVTFRFASKYHFSFYNAPTFRFVGLKINEDLVTIEAIKNYEDIQGILNNKPKMFHVRFVYDPTGTHQIFFDKDMPFIPVVGQKFYWKDWNDLDSPFYIEEVHLAFKDDGQRNFDGIWCWCTD